MTAWELLATSVVSLVIGVFVLAIGIMTETWYVAALGGLQLLVFGPLVAILPNWMWNASKQTAISNARFKSLEASQLWAKVDPIFHYQAKDLYFETSYGGKTLKVLRDGTIEMHGAHTDEEDEEDEGGDEEDEGGLDDDMEALVTDVVG